MSEKSELEPNVIRLTSSRKFPSMAMQLQAPGSPSGHGNQAPQSSGDLLGEEWLEDAEDEVFLHQAMDAVEDACTKSDESCRDRNYLSKHVDYKSAANFRKTTHSVDILLQMCTCKTETEIKSKTKSNSKWNQNDESQLYSPDSDTNTNSIISVVEGEKSNFTDNQTQSASTSGNKTKSLNKCPFCFLKSALGLKRGSSPNCSQDQENKSENEIIWKKARTGANIELWQTPLKQFKGNYLWVSDLTAQAWCERQLLYDLTFEGPVEILETEAMKVGSEMHLKRELEVHTIKQIAVTTKEDKWAIKFLNILSATNQLLLKNEGKFSKCVVREMPIFGKPFQNGAFVVGVIDEIRYNSKDQLELVEFKTRSKARSLPSAAQRKAHKLQVMLYKQLFDEAVCGSLTKETILETIGLDPDATVNEEIKAHALKMFLDLPKLEDYLTTVLERFKFLPQISSLVVEYSSQDDKKPFAIDEHVFDPIWLKERMAYYNAFWEGRREVEGVDVEDVWKCNFCNFKEECDWRKKMHEKCLSRNSRNHVKIEHTA